MACVGDTYVHMRSFTFTFFGVFFCSGKGLTNEWEDGYEGPCSDNHDHLGREMGDGQPR